MSSALNLRIQLKFIQLKYFVLTLFAFIYDKESFKNMVFALKLDSVNEVLMLVLFIVAKAHYDTSKSSCIEYCQK